jgi:DTW domain-containing protein YfiP
VIIRFALGTSATIALANDPVYRTANTITATTSTASRVTFLANGKRIAGCISKSTVSLVASCSWSPSLHGLITLSVLVVPVDTNYPTINSALAAKHVVKRTTRR